MVSVMTGSGSPSTDGVGGSAGRCAEGRRRTREDWKAFRDLVESTQMVLIVLAGVSGGLVALALWRLRGARGAPLGAIGVVLVAALSLILPLAV